MSLSESFLSSVTIMFSLNPGHHKTRGTKRKS